MLPPSDWTSTRAASPRRRSTSFTGEVSQRSFGTDAGEIAAWIKGFEDPQACYEPGPTGFRLRREVRRVPGVELVDEQAVVGACVAEHPPPTLLST